MSRRKRRQTVFPRAGTVARNVKKSLSCAWLLKQDIFSFWYLFREIPCKQPKDINGHFGSRSSIDFV